MQTKRQAAKEMPWDPVWEYILGDDPDGDDGSLPASPNQHSMPRRRFWQPAQDEGSLTNESDSDGGSDDPDWWGSDASDGSADDEERTIEDNGSWTLGLDPFMARSSSTLATGPKQADAVSKQGDLLPSIEKSRDDGLAAGLHNSIKSVLSWENQEEEQKAATVTTSPQTSRWRTRGVAAPLSSKTKFWRRKSKVTKTDVEQQESQPSAATKKKRTLFGRTHARKGEDASSKSDAPTKSRLFDWGEATGGRKSNSASQIYEREALQASAKQTKSEEDSILQTNAVFDWAGNANELSRTGHILDALAWSSTHSDSTPQSDSNTNPSYSDRDESCTDRGESLSTRESNSTYPASDIVPQFQKIINWIESSDSEDETDTGTQEGSYMTEESPVTPSLASSESGMRPNISSSFVPLRRQARKTTEEAISREVSNFSKTADTASGQVSRGGNENQNSGERQAFDRSGVVASVAAATAAAIVPAAVLGTKALSSPELSASSQKSASKKTFRRKSKKENKGERSKKGANRGFVKRALCATGRCMTPEQQWISSQTGVPYNELTPQELAMLFPKVRSVCDEGSVSSSSVMLGSFDRSLPAHLQADLGMNGPHSLFEYEYETGVHMQIAYNEFDQIELTSMKLESLSTPTPKRAQSKKDSNEVIVQVEASVVSRTDCAIRRGDWWGDTPTPLPITPGVDAVGKLFSVDGDSQRRYNLNVGDRVMTLCSDRIGPPRGGNSRYLAIKPDQLVRVSDTVDPALAACLPETYLSAFQVLHHGQNVEERYEPGSLQGSSVLLVGKVISNEGRAISELARTAGANVFALCPQNHFSKIVTLGIHPLDMNSIEWWDEVSGMIDCIACIDEDVATIHYKLLKPAGRVVQIKSDTCGNGPAPPKVDARKQKGKQKQPKDITTVYDVFQEWETNTECCKTDLHFLILLLQQEKLHPKLLDRVPLNKVENAHELLMYKRLNGFIVCEPWLVAKSRAVLL